MSIDIVLLAVANALSYKHSYCLDAYVARSLTLGIRIGFILKRNMEYSNTENNADMTAVDSFVSFTLKTVLNYMNSPLLS